MDFGVYIVYIWAIVMIIVMYALRKTKYLHIGMSKKHATFIFKLIWGKEFNENNIKTDIGRMHKIVYYYDKDADERNT